LGQYFDGKKVNRIVYTTLVSRLKDCDASFIPTISKLLNEPYFRHLRGDYILFDLRTYIFYLIKLTTCFLQYSSMKFRRYSMMRVCWNEPGVGEIHCDTGYFLEVTNICIW